MKQSRNIIPETKILNLISYSVVALSHTEIQSYLGGLRNRVTIYRILDRLAEEGFFAQFILVLFKLFFALKHATVKNIVFLKNELHYYNCHFPIELYLCENRKKSRWKSQKLTIQKKQKKNGTVIG